MKTDRDHVENAAKHDAYFEHKDFGAVARQITRLTNILEHMVEFYGVDPAVCAGAFDRSGEKEKTFEIEESPRNMRRIDLIAGDTCPDCGMPGCSCSEIPDGYGDG